jgi:hypothetical protein
MGNSCDCYDRYIEFRSGIQGYLSAYLIEDDIPLLAQAPVHETSLLE